MSSLSDVKAASQRPGFQDQNFSGRTDKTELAAYHRLDAGLTIKTREGDIVTLSTSRFSSLNAREYNSQGIYTTKDGSVSGQIHERQIELASGETFAFSVQGDLNEQELADIENIVSSVDGIIYEMAGGNMDDAIAKALSMGSYDSVARYEANISVAQAYSVSSQTSAVNGNSALPGGYGDVAGSGSLLSAALESPFMKSVSQLLKEQEVQTLTYARQPLSQLFGHYLAQQDGLEKAGSDTLADAPTPAADAAKSPLALALESTAKMVDQLIQDMVKDAFEHTLDQVV